MPTVSRARCRRPDRHVHVDVDVDVDVDGRVGERGEVLAWVATMASVFVLTVLALALGVRFYANETAQAAAEHGVEVAQTVGANDTDTETATLGLIRSSPLLRDATVHITRTPSIVTVIVDGSGAMGGHVTATATGPVDRFISETNR